MTYPGDGSPSDPPGHPVGDGPSMLDLVRLSPRLLFPPGGRELARQIAILTDLSPDDEVIIVGCGNGVTLEYFVTEYGVHGSGVDADAHLLTAAEERARERELAESMQFQHAAGDSLPYRDEIFDVAVGELGLTHEADAADAVRELVRVTRPGGTIVLVQPVWKAPVDETRRRVISDHLGVKPLMLVEWKRMLREAGVEHLHTEDWTDEETAFRASVPKPFPDFAELFSLTEKLGILRRAWQRWGWRGVRSVLLREREVHDLLTRERILGLDLVKGVKSGAPAAAEEEPSVPEGEMPAEEASGDVGSSPPDTPPDEDEEEADTDGLPLFSLRDENP